MSLQVRFQSLVEKYVVPETPIQVPLHLKPADLSDIVHHLLALDHRAPFEFLIDGQILRTSLQAYLDRQKLSAVHF